MPHHNSRALLAISWEMPPMYGPRATQVARTLAALGGMGWRSTVVCLAPRRGGPHWRDGVAAPAIDGVDLVRVPSPEEWPLIRAAGRIVPILRSFPDPQWVWVERAVRAALRAVNAARAGGLVSFAQPWSDHLVGLRVSRKTRLPWVAHFSDPWVDSAYGSTPRWQMPLWRRIEEDVIREASAVVFVSEQTADLVMKKYPAAWRSKVSVVPHGFDPRAQPAAGARTRTPGPLRIVYTGRFYSGVRTPVAFLKALASLNERGDAPEVTFIGPHVAEFDREAAALGVSTLVRFRPRVPPDEAAAIAADADVLLVVDAPTAGPSPFLPSKLIDYLPFRKPILGVTPAQGASADLLRRLGCPVAPPDDVQAIAGALSDLVAKFRAGTLVVSAAFEPVAAEYDITRTTARLHEALMTAFRRQTPI